MSAGHMRRALSLPQLNPRRKPDVVAPLARWIAEPTSSSSSKLDLRASSKDGARGSIPRSAVRFVFHSLDSDLIALHSARSAKLRADKPSYALLAEKLRSTTMSHVRDRSWFNPATICELATVLSYCYLRQSISSDSSVY